MSTKATKSGGTDMRSKTVSESENLSLENPLTNLKIRKICWDESYLPDLFPDKRYLYISFKPTDCQLTREDLQHLIAVQVRGIIWLGTKLIRILKTQNKNYVLVFVCNKAPPRLEQDKFTFKEEKVVFHFLNKNTGERKQITCYP